MQLVKLAALAFAVPVALAQQPSKPQISNITAVPADTALSQPACMTSRAGYLETIGKEKMTEAKLAKFIASSLRVGYILTIYPESKGGIFVDMQCPARQSSTVTPSHPSYLK